MEPYCNLFIEPLCFYTTTTTTVILFFFFVVVVVAVIIIIPFYFLNTLGRSSQGRLKVVIIMIYYYHHQAYYYSSVCTFIDVWHVTCLHKTANGYVRYYRVIYDDNRRDDDDDDDNDEAVSPQSCRIGSTFMCTGLKTTIRVGSSFAVHVTVTSELDRHLAGIFVITFSRLPGMHGQFNLLNV